MQILLNFKRDINLLQKIEFLLICARHSLSSVFIPLLLISILFPHKTKVVFSIVLIKVMLFGRLSNEDLTEI